MKVGDLVKYVLRSGEEVTALILQLERASVCSYGEMHAEIYFSKSGERGWTPVENLQVLQK